MWQKNRALHELWRKHEAEQAAPEKLEAWLEQMKQHADSLDLPMPPAEQGLLHREHLRKALQAAVYHYMAEVKRAKELG